MGLKVWLPLNNTLENKGISDYSITKASAVTFNASGKIGYCAMAESSANITITVPDIAEIFGEGTQYSLACWVKVQGRSANGWAVKFGSNSCGLWWGYSAARWVWNENDNGKRISSEIASDITNWHHIAVTVDKTTSGQITTKQYVDGAPAPGYPGSTFSASATLPTGTTITINPYVASLNDIRIYDHCLSAAEVREISQGLVLHYKLDGFQGNFGNPNLVNGSNSASTSTNTWNFSMQTGDKTNTIEYEDNIPILVITRGSVEQSGWCFLSYNNLRRNEIKTSTTYTVSFDIKSVQSGTINFTGFLQSNATNYMTQSTKVIQGTVNANVWSHIVLQCTTKDSFDGITIGNQIVYMSPSTSLRATGNIMKFKNIKVEEGTVETPWCPADSEFTIDRTHIQDSSGYGHNGSIYGTTQLISDSPRYSTAIELTSTSSHINASGLTTSGFGSSYSFVWWAKSNSTTNMHWGFSDGIRLNGLYNGNLWNTGDSSNNPLYKPGTTTGISVTEANVWHHWAMTGDGTTCKVYKDGVHVANAKTWKAISGTSLWFNGWQNATNYAASSLALSDFRLYATALSADDIKQLYELGAKVDNKGNIHSFELIETGPNKITKQGQLKGFNLHEIPDLFAYDPVIYIEPDGTKWAHIFHHNNPTSYKFASTDTFNSFVYIDENRWFNFSPCNYLDKYEFFAEVKKQANDSITKYRWIQTMSPLTATFDSTKSANVTKITTTGYTACALGGLYHVSANTWLAMNNGTNNNWYGAVGCWSAWNGGITGWATGSANAITTGLVDIYVRVDNIDFSTINLIAKSIKTDRWQANEFIEL